MRPAGSAPVHASGAAGVDSSRSSGVIAVTTSTSAVKGIWLSTARRYLLERHGTYACEEVAEAMGELGDALRNPLASEWYPEETLQAGLGAMRLVVAQDDPEKFLSVMETCTALGIHSFFRALIRLGTPPILLRKVPALWSRVRRGDAVVTVDAGDTSALVRYARFPYFYDVSYRILTVASLRALVRICAGRAPRVDIVHYERDALDVAITY